MTATVQPSPLAGQRLVGGRLLAGAGVVVVLAGAGGLAALLLHGRAAPAAATTAVPVGTAHVTRTDITSSQRLNGTLGYAAPFTVSAPGGATPDQLQQAGSAVIADQAALSAATQAAGDTAAANQLAISQAQAAVNAAAGNPTALATAQQTLAAAQLHAQQSQHQADSAVISDRLKLQNDQAILASAQSTARLDGSYTWLPAPGAVISQGQHLYAVNGRPVTLLYGSMPAWRELGPGASGDDVRQLEEDMTDLGYANAGNLTVDGSFTSADTAAVNRWQEALGLPQTGVVRLGEIVFAPTSVRVATVRATLGVPAQPGSAVLDLTSTRHTVVAQLDAGHQQVVHPGDHVSVLMPDGHTTIQGSVTDVSRVATQPPQGQGNGGPPGGQTPTVAVTIALTDESAAGTLDQAPVYVTITTQSKKGVLAVPVTALLAQPNGDYAVAVHSGGSRRLVVVQPGLFGDSGLVEVTGTGLAVGDVVEVPAR